MKEASQITACVLDHGLFLPAAHRLAEAYQRVLYWTPHEQGFPSVKRVILGDGFEDIEWCDEFWSLKHEIDLFVVFDIGLSALQLELESQGFPVWGPRWADSIELDREKFLRLLSEKHLDVPKHEVFEGLSALRDHLIDTEDRYIKISRYRGDMETFHWRSWSLDEVKLDELAMRFGPAKELIRFLVFEPIETDIEIGSDTYCVDGQWPSKMINGTEWKDQAYIGVVTDTVDMPEQALAVLEAFKPEFEKYRYRCEFSSEIRVKGDQAYFTDPTTRGGLPSTGSQLKLWTNFPEIVWAGAHGVLIEPEPTADYSVELMLKTKAPKGAWSIVEMPDELKPWAMLANCCMIDGRYCFPPDENHEDDIGWLVAIGDTPQEVIASIKEKVDLLPDGITTDVSPLADILREMENAEKEGVLMSDDKLPEPSTVIE